MPIALPRCRAAALSALLLVAVGLAGCAPAPKPFARPGLPPAGERIRTEIGDSNPWTSLRVANDPDNFHFALISDRTGGARPGIFEDGLRKLNLLGPEFVLYAGDLIEGKTEDRTKLDEEWDEATKLLATLEMPLFLIPGNHDITNPVMARKWNELFGRPYYHFTYRGVLFLMLDTEDGAKAHIGPDQIDYAAQALAKNRSARWTFVVLHEPLWLETKPTGWEKIEALLGKRPYTVFAGHDHSYMEYNRNGHKYIRTGTLGGASGLAGPAAGEFDEIVWITMQPDGPRIANLALDGILPDDFLTEAVAKLGEGLRGGAFLQADPLLVDGDTFDGREVAVHLANPADLPLKFRGAFQDHPDIVAAPKTLEKVVPPRGTETLKVRLDTRGPMALKDAPPLELRWTAAYEPPGRPALQARGSQSLAPEKVLVCTRRDGPVVVDGKLDEWKDLPFACTEPAQVRGDAKAWRGQSDGSFRFAVQYDARFLYIAIDVTDDALVLDPTKSVWDQDGLEVRVDARPDPARSAGRGKDEGKDFVMVGLSPGRTEAEMVRFEPSQWPEGTLAACVKTDKGWSAEIAIPVAYLDEKQGGAWKEFRLNIALDDVDSPTGKGQQLWWRPDWRGAMNYAGSGTFRK